MSNILSRSLILLVSIIPLCVNGETWSPNPKFSMEGSSYKETLIFISGISYALTYSEKAIKEKGGSNYYCLPPGKIPDSKLLIGLLNEELSGEHSAKEIILNVTRKLSQKYPCGKDMGETNTI